MKRLIIILFSLVIATGIAAPYGIRDIPNVQVENRYRFTSNPDGILSNEAVKSIDSICYDLRHRGIAQVAVVAVESIKSDDVFEFAYDLFSEWGVGSRSNSGIGILLVEDVHEIRFITGYGIEGVLPDAICKRIQTQYMLPHFRREDYSSGMVAGVEAIRAVLNGSELDAGGNDDYTDEDDEAIVGFLIFFFGFVLLYFGLIWVVHRRSRRCPECKQVALRLDSTRVLSHVFGVTNHEDTFVCKKCGAVIKRQRRSGSSNSSNNRGGGGPFIGGFGGGRFGGGGGSSFGGGWGGGSFGGGGAGSRW